MHTAIIRTAATGASDVLGGLWDPAAVTELDPKLPSVRCCRCGAAIAGRLGVRSADTMHGLQQVFHNPVTWHILANQVLLTATLVGFDHFEAIEGASHGSCIAINAVKIAQDEDIHLGSEETRNGFFRSSDDRFLFVEACV